MDFAEEMHSNMREMNFIMTRILTKKLRDDALTPSQSIALLYISENGEKMTVSNVCEKLKTPLSNTTNICNKLHDLGYINKTRDEVDHRKVYVEATKKGLNLAQDAFKSYSELKKFIDEGFSSEEKEQGIIFMRKASAMLNEYFKKIN